MNVKVDKKGKGTMLLRKSELHKLPHIKNIPKDGRAIPLSQFFDDRTREWRLLIPHDEDHLVRLLDGEPIIGHYLSHSPADDFTDLEFGLGTLIIQHCRLIPPCRHCRS